LKRHITVEELDIRSNELTELTLPPKPMPRKAEIGLTSSHWTLIFEKVIPFEKEGQFKS